LRSATKKRFSCVLAFFGLFCVAYCVPCVLYLIDVSGLCSDAKVVSYYWGQLLTYFLSLFNIYHSMLSELLFTISDAIKNRYLGAERRKKRIRRQNDRKFIFDWENTDDTSADYNPIYSDRHYTQVSDFPHRTTYIYQ
jgi:hypothetical protein